MALDWYKRLALGLVEVVMDLEVEVVMDLEMDNGQNNSIFCTEFFQLQLKRDSKGAIQETYIQLCCTQYRDPEATSPHQIGIP